MFSFVSLLSDTCAGEIFEPSLIIDMGTKALVNGAEINGFHFADEKNDTQVKKYLLLSTRHNTISGRQLQNESFMKMHSLFLDS